MLRGALQISDALGEVLESVADGAEQTHADFRLQLNGLRLLVHLDKHLEQIFPKADQIIYDLPTLQGSVSYQREEELPEIRTVVLDDGLSILLAVEHNKVNEFFCNVHLVGLHFHIDVWHQ